MALFCILLKSVISIHCECKQTKTWKRKTWADRRNKCGGGGGEKKQSAGKTYLGTRREMQVTRSFTGSTARHWDKKHMQATKAGSRHTDTKRTFFEDYMTHISVHLCKSSGTEIADQSSRDYSEGVMRWLIGKEINFFWYTQLHLKNMFLSFLHVNNWVCLHLLVFSKTIQ